MNPPIATPRRRHYQEAVLLAVSSPMIAELLSSSAPPFQFFIPWVFGLFVTFYGCAALLARELTLRRQSGWPGILLFGAAFMILNEGLSAKVIFDPHAQPLGLLTDHGRWFGINFIWTLDGVAYHSVFSVALPILLVHHLRPQSSKEPWLGRTGLWVVTGLFCFSSGVFLTHAKPYEVSTSVLVSCWVAAAVLVGAGLVKTAGLTIAAPKQAVPPKKFLWLGLSFGWGILLHIYAVPALTRLPWITLLVGVVGYLAVIRWMIQWTGYGSSFTRPQQGALLCGCIGGLAIVALFHEINPTRTYDATGMSVIGLVVLAGLWRLWRKTVRFSEPIDQPIGPS